MGCLATGRLTDRHVDHNERARSQVQGCGERLMSYATKEVLGSSTTSLFNELFQALQRVVLQINDDHVRNLVGWITLDKRGMHW